MRRLAALCLLFLGVHAAADLLDDWAFAVLDSADLLVDRSLFAVFSWLARVSPLEPARVMAAAEGAAEWIGVEEKDTAALWLALLCELWIDLKLIGFAWGERPAADEPKAPSPWRRRVRDGLQKAWPLDPEIVAVLPIMSAFCLGGIIVAGLAFERAAAPLVTALTRDLRIATSISAGVAALFMLIVALRFLPDLLAGTTRRALSRKERAEERYRRRVGVLVDDDRGRLAASSERQSQVAAAKLLRYWRGLTLAVVVLPVAVVCLTSQSAVTYLWARLLAAWS